MELNPQLDNNVQKGDTNETTVITHPIIPNDTTNAQGLHVVEETTNDPNAINVTIVDQSSPIVVLFGPPACGKTMTLVRLTRYLTAEGYLVQPDETFRDAHDSYYAEMCRHFNASISSNDAAGSTKNISFMLVRVVKNGKVVCQILEAPGEGYFKPDNPNEPTPNFPAYVNTIISSSNRKIWCFMVEPNWGNSQNDRVKYAQKIAMLKNQLRPQDKALFIFNKIDTTNYTYAPGKVHMDNMKKGIEGLYPSIFKPFTTKSIFGKIPNYKVIPFMSGYYSPKIAGGSSYQEGSKEYPQMLWNAILAYRKG